MKAVLCVGGEPRDFLFCFHYVGERVSGASTDPGTTPDVDIFLFDAVVSDLENNRKNMQNRLHALCAIITTLLEVATVKR